MLIALALVTVACNGEGTIEGCTVYKDHHSNLNDVSYSLYIPDECPVDLADPGNETKYFSVQINDCGQRDAEFGYVEIENSAGLELIESRYEYLVYDLDEKCWWARPEVQYTAATGTRTFDDHDTGIGYLYRTSAGPVLIGEGRVRITYEESNLSAEIGGPSIPASQTTQTWTANVSGGVAPFSYRWYRNGSFVGTGYGYTASTGSEDFDLRVEVDDQTWSSINAVFVVDVDGINASISGPTTVYESEGGGTWSASAVGGNGSFTYEWYIDENLVGSGDSWSGYPGDYQQMLHLVVVDTEGENDSDAIQVYGIGGNENCTPVPPAITC